MGRIRRGAPVAGAMVALLLLPSVSVAQNAPLPGVPYPGGAYPPPPPGFVQPGALPYGYPNGWWPVAILRSNSQRARLQMRTPLRWQDICMAPCSAWVDPKGTFRIGGGVIQPSEPFTLPRPSGQILIDARATTIMKHWTGFGMMIFGALSATTGLVLYTTAPDAMPNDWEAERNRDGQQAGGLVFGILGVVLLAVSIPMFLRGTSVEIE